jgi:hypothetical protein
MDRYAVLEIVMSEEMEREMRELKEEDEEG